MMIDTKRKIATLLLTSSLVACGGGGSSQPAPTGGGMPPAPASNTAPTISGSPSGNARAGDAYSFTPTASDADGDTLTFSAENLPAWATLDTATGAVTGLAVEGAFADIVITVTDGTDTATLAPFTLTVGTAPVVRNGDLGAFTTASGTWRVKAEATGDAAGIAQGYVWSLDETPGWESPMVCNDTVEDRTTTFRGVTFFTPSYSCKFAQSEPPVQVDGARIRKAIEDERWMPYRASRAEGWPLYYDYASRDELVRLSGITYDPAAMNGENSSRNNVGTISGQGGEYTTSRGATDEADAQLIALALEGEDVSVWTDALYAGALSFAGYPNRVVVKDGMLRDPQKPGTGKQYEYRTGGNEVTDEVESHLRYENWTYDHSHNANVGWALWLGTEDPRIGMIVQSHFQFGLSDFPEYLREAFMEGERRAKTGNMSTYQCSFRQTRATYNCLTSMWRARDVADRVRSGDVMLWGKTRMDEMYAEVEQQLWDYMDQVTQAPADDDRLQGLKILGAPFPSASCAQFRDSADEISWHMTRSNFMDVQYGGAIAYLAARNGERVGIHMMEQLGKQFVTRLHHLGGSMGLAHRRDTRGSGMPVGPCKFVDGSDRYREAAPLPFSDGPGWADWARGLDIAGREDRAPASTTEFTHMSGHTAVQAEFVLHAARQLGDAGYITPVADVDAAIASVDAAKAMTPERTIYFGLWYKHSHDLFED